MAKDHPTGESGLYSALLELKTPEECYRFLQDVCSYAELSAMEQRYNIADKLDSVLRRLVEEKAEAPTEE